MGLDEDEEEVDVEVGWRWRTLVRIFVHGGSVRRILESVTTSSLERNQKGPTCSAAHMCNARRFGGTLDFWWVV